jgi:putative transcriptional regulator
MGRAKRNVGLEILEGVRQLKRGEHGRIINVPSVASVREKTGLSQARFAELLGVSVRTLQEWEQGRRAPSGAARTLLLIAAKNPGRCSMWREDAPPRPQLFRVLKHGRSRRNRGVDRFDLRSGGRSRLQPIDGAC